MLHLIVTQATISQNLLTKLNVCTTCSMPASFGEIAHLITLHATPIATAIFDMLIDFLCVQYFVINIQYNWSAKIWKHYCFRKTSKKAVHKNNQQQVRIYICQWLLLLSSYSSSETVYLLLSTFCCQSSTVSLLSIRETILWNAAKPL